VVLLTVLGAALAATVIGFFARRWWLPVVIAAVGVVAVVVDVSTGDVENPLLVAVVQLVLVGVVTGFAALGGALANSRRRPRPPTRLQRPPQG
jgi:hypothetical protein